jgi:ABC-type lipoprotein release transport system permease subunit
LLIDVQFTGLEKRFNRQSAIDNEIGNRQLAIGNNREDLWLCQSTIFTCVISFSVSERTREIGIRMALGAKRRDVLRMILGQGMRVSALGIVIGLAIALGLTRWLRSLLFEVSATDPITFVLVAMMVSLVALIACYLPARRATRVDPLVALKDE